MLSCIGYSVQSASRFSVGIILKYFPYFFVFFMLPVFSDSIESMQQDVNDVQNKFPAQRCTGRKHALMKKSVLQ